MDQKHVRNAKILPICPWWANGPIHPVWALAYLPLQAKSLLSITSEEEEDLDADAKPMASNLKLAASSLAEVADSKALLPSKTYFPTSGG